MNAAVVNVFVSGFSTLELVGRAAAQVILHPFNTRHLRLFFEIEDRVKNRMVKGEVADLLLWKFIGREQPFDFIFKCLPFPVAPEVIHHHEPAVEQIFSKHRNFRLVQKAAPRLNEIDEREFAQIRLGHLHDPSIGIDLDGGHLVQAVGKVQVTRRKINQPTAVCVHVSWQVFIVLRSVAESRKGEGIAFEFLVHRPGWCRICQSVRLARRVEFDVPRPAGQRISQCKPCDPEGGDGYGDVAAPFHCCFARVCLFRRASATLGLSNRARAWTFEFTQRFKNSTFAVNSGVRNLSGSRI